MISKTTIKPIRMRIQEKRKQIAAQSNVISELIQIQGQCRKELDILLEEERLQKRSFSLLINNSKQTEPQPAVLLADTSK
ncbi:hypothetical protein [Xanthocytophaga agilis]|uniref:Uncharacterized protein n=1 Tax=Xanthocytophaga agilis TaxID=3048010 RepID=A0AAE3R9I2_9BACT|nr:hypothetical protein [Xanthocytophaga agilis]MDJ1506159.1 hypothetical protein [Xanthocytophaga agilis]